MHVTGGKTLALGLVLPLVLSLLATWPGVACDDANGILVKYQIHIRDALKDPNSKLLVHCKSGDSDKGIRVLAPGEEYTWGTMINMPKTTLYFCFVRWEGVKERYFEAFKAKRDEVNCGDKSACFWKVKDNGVYFSHNDIVWNNTYPW